MPTHEHTINDALAAALRLTRHSWRDSDVVKSETTRTLRGSNERPDILILEPYVSPVAIETEASPARTLEADATSRLGAQLRDNGRAILSSIAIRFPSAFCSLSGTRLHAAIRSAGSFEIALYTGCASEDAQRLPESGWITGSVADLSILAQQASVPPDVINQAATVLEDGIKSAAGLVGEMLTTHSGALGRVCLELKQADCVQTRRMAAAILANAFVFHHSLAGQSGELADVRSIAELRDRRGIIGQQAVLTEWRKILDVNYWPIFDIAHRILTIIPTAVAHSVIDTLASTADKLVENRLMRSHDLTGAVFQRLIADRKFLAAYYTTPAAAALLSGLAITDAMLPASVSWANATDVGQLRVADLACGTGTLLSTAYQRIGQLHELHGGDSEALHPVMMADGLVGCDVLPAAAHLTASMLAGTHPTKTYDRSSVLTVAYGKQPGGRISLGSLDLLDPQQQMEHYAITAKGSGPKRRTRMALPHGSFDLVVMNPPFTRPTTNAGESLGVPNAMFAAFGSSKEEQRRMGEAMDVRTRGTCYHGNAGEASAFLSLGNSKLKRGGSLALVLPLALLAGDSWEESREVLAKEYENLVVVSIAAAKDSDASFSADTDMGECLVVGRKFAKPWQNRGQIRATFVVLNERPKYPLVGAQIARQVRRLIDGGNLRRLEDGPFGGTPIKFGDEIVGQAMDAALQQSGPWPLSRIRDMSLAQAAYQIAAHGRFWLPGMSSESMATVAPISTVNGIGGKIGPHHRDVIAKSGGTIRGPFQIESAAPGTFPTYPILWGHQAGRERQMTFEADCEGHPIKGKNAREKAFLAKKLLDIDKTATHCHVNNDFRFNSQSTAMQFTRRRTISGRAWHSLGLATPEQEKAVVVWGNTTFGLLLFWWHSSKQQTGRGSIAKTALATLPVLDVTTISSAALGSAVEIFDEMCDRALLPVNQIDSDPVRAELDEAFGRRVLNMDAAAFATGGPLDLLRMKLACEPTIKGSKKSKVELAVGSDDED